MKVEPNSSVIIRTACRVCGRLFDAPILSLGDLYISDFLDDAETGAASKYPLELVLCNPQDGGCGLLQLRHTVSHDTLYRNYWYRSGMNATMTRELHGIARTVESLVQLTPSDFVIDIGANDGTLLRGYTTPAKKIGFEPARNLLPYNREGTTKIINDFFSHEEWAKEFGRAKAKAITAIAMFYDLDDPNKFIADVAECLRKDGVFIVQMSYLPSMLSQNAFDNIVHEHLEYYSLLSLENLLRRHGLEVFDVELNDVNGGSFRTYIRHALARNPAPPAGALERLAKLRGREETFGLHERKIYDDFGKRVFAIRDALYRFVERETTAGKTVYVYGASTKGNTLLQFCNFDSRLLPAAAERNADKWGKKTVGTAIPIISEEEARAKKPHYFFVLPWHFMKEFKDRERAFLASGGKFIIPLPEPRVLGKNENRDRLL